MLLDGGVTLHKSIKPHHRFLTLKYTCCGWLTRPLKGDAPGGAGKPGSAEDEFSMRTVSISLFKFKMTGHERGEKMSIR